MCAQPTHPRFVLSSLLVAATLCASLIGLTMARAAIVDPLANGPVDPDLFNNKPATQPDSQTAPKPQTPREDIRPANFQTNPQPPSKNPPAKNDPPQTLPAPTSVMETKDPCDAVPRKPLNQLGINIAEPEGKLPTDLAAPCWVQINQTSSPSRCWPVSFYNWEATCFYHNPLYFEEVNLERYGYQCGDRCCCCTCGRECCLQPAASAAHFYGSVLALPYCMAVECPGDCVYTLGHYRPGNCNPWRWHWPPCDALAAAAAGGFYTGMIFAIP